MSESETTRQMTAALGRVPSGLFILTARKDDVETGMLASWVQQCSFNPPLLSVAVRKDREINTWLTPGAGLVLNILDDTQTDMIAHFGRGFALQDPAFTGLPVERTEQGIPVLSEALAYLLCQVTQVFPSGDHNLYMAQVVGGKMLGDGQPMVHVRKNGSHY